MIRACLVWEALPRSQARRYAALCNWLVSPNQGKAKACELSHIAPTRLARRCAGSGERPWKRQRGITMGTGWSIATWWPTALRLPARLRRRSPEPLATQHLFDR